MHGSHDGFEDRPGRVVGVKAPDNHPQHVRLASTMATQHSMHLPITPGRLPNSPATAPPIPRMPVGILPRAAAADIVPHAGGPGENESARYRALLSFASPARSTACASLYRVAMPGPLPVTLTLKRSATITEQVP